MSSITLPALAIQPPPNPVEQYARMAQLKGLLQQQQIQQQMAPAQIQEAQNRAALTGLQGQQAQFQIAQQKAIAKSFQDAVRPDADGVPQIDPEVISRNIAGSGYATPEVLKGIEDFNKSIIGTRTAMTDLQSKTNDLIGGAASAIRAANYNPQVAHTLLDALPQNPQVNAIRQTIDNNPAQFKQLIDGAWASSMKQQEFANQLKVAGIRANTPDAQALKAALETGQIKDASEFPAWKEAQTAAAAQRAQTSPAAVSGAATKAGAEETARINAQNKGLTGDNGQPSAIAQALAANQMKWSEVVSARTPQATKEELLRQVKSINPNFNSGDFALEQSVRREFTSGDAAKNLTAFNTAIEHANQLSTAADALQNGDVVALNKIGNALGYQFGSNKQTNFNVIKNALSGEISKVFKGGQATDAEIKEVEAPFSAANSPAQLKGAINNAIQLMNSKRDALQQQYQQGIKAQPNFGGNAPAPTQSSTATPQTHQFSVSAWQKANPKGNPLAARQAATAQGYQVVP